METDSDKLISVVQAGFRLGVNPRWLKREAEAGRVPAIDCGGTLLVNLSAVREALADRAAVERVRSVASTGTPCPPIPREEDRP